jgi:hypothetical protein
MSEESELHFALNVLTLGATDRPFVASVIPLMISGASEAVY